MALLFADGFEHYGTGGTGRTNMVQGEYLMVGSTTNPDTAQSRTGSRSFLLSNSTTALGVTKLVQSSSNEIGVAFGLYLESVITGGLLSLLNASTAILTLRVTAAGAIEVRRGTWSSTVLATTDIGLVTAASWNHIECRVLRDNVVGEVEIRVNGEVELVLANVDLGLQNVDIVGFYGFSSNPKGYIDDLIIWDASGDVNNTFFGPARVTTLGLDGDEVGNQWSVTGAASGAAALTEAAPDGDTSYVSAAVVNMTSEYGIESLPPEAEVIAGVYVPAMGKLAVAGIGSAQISIVSGSDVESGPDTPLTTAYTYRGQVFEKDPATGQLWTKSDLEAAKIRIEKTA